jgi:glucose/arabinose dehydrogenase
LYGKILRIDPDGTVPADNPFPGNPVWSYGHRNPQGIDWYPGTDVMYSTEHGPSGFDGPGGGDEVNVIVKGGNYGWPEVSHEDSREGMISPVLVYTPAVAPADCMFYRSGVIEQFRNNLFIACLRGNAVIRVAVDVKDPGKVVCTEKMSDVRFGRIREIAEGPDGSIYFSTSNRDGRGRPAENDDRIFRIKAK